MERQSLRVERTGGSAEVELGPRTIQIGRDPTCELVVDDASVRPIHAMISAQYMLRSPFGVFLRGRKVTEVNLSEEGAVSLDADSEVVVRVTAQRSDGRTSAAAPRQQSRIDSAKATVAYRGMETSRLATDGGDVIWMNRILADVLTASKSAVERSRAAVAELARVDGETRATATELDRLKSEAETARAECARLASAVDERDREKAVLAAETEELRARVLAADAIASRTLAAEQRVVDLEADVARARQEVSEAALAREAAEDRAHLVLAQAAEVEAANARVAVAAAERDEALRRSASASNMLDQARRNLAARLTLEDMWRRNAEDARRAADLAENKARRLESEIEVLQRRISDAAYLQAVDLKDVLGTIDATEVLHAEAAALQRRIEELERENEALRGR